MYFTQRRKIIHLSMFDIPLIHVYYRRMIERGEDLIQAAEREIRRDSEDLSRLKRRYPGYDFILVSKPNENLTVDDRKPAPPLSIIQIGVLGVIESSSAREWTSRTVLTELTDHGQVSFPTDEAAMNAVGLALAALAESGHIIRTHQGRGRDPHRYKAIEKEVRSQEKTS